MELKNEVESGLELGKKWKKPGGIWEQLWTNGGLELGKIQWNMRNRFWSLQHADPRTKWGGSVDLEIA